MIKVGDYIKMKKERKTTRWYDEESYLVIGITVNKVGKRVLVLDRYFPTNPQPLKRKDLYNLILEDFVDLDLQKTRESKVKSIIDD